MTDHPIPPCDVLKEMLTNRRVLLPDGTYKRTTSGIGADHAWALYSMVLKHRPGLVIEIGMAQGFSTLSILCALAQTGGRLISIDPYIGWPSGCEAALHSVRTAGYGPIHQHIKEVSETALPRLAAEGTRIELGYIDGNHDFDHAFIDFFYLDRLLAEGGVLGFNNAGWIGVFDVIRYMRRHRAYAELDAGLKPDYSARNPLLSLARRLLRRPRQDRYFQKRGPEEGSAPGC